MGEKYHFGDEVTQYGSNNIGIIKSQGSADPRAALQEMAATVQVLRGQVSAADRQVIDEAMDTIRADGGTKGQSFRRALRDIAGIATMVGQVGAPVIEAVRKVMSAFGIQ